MYKSLVIALAMFASTLVFAEPVLDKDYSQTAQTIPTDNPAKIEVTELFWYGCPHCYHMEPELATWLKKLPADVYFKRIPGLPRPDWAPMAKAYYSLEALGLTEKLHTKLFEAIHKEKTLRPDDEAGAIDWITKQSGLDRKKVDEAFKSFSLNTKLNQAMQVFRASGATGVPALIIDGKYVTSSSMAGGNAEALKTADFLIANARKDKSAKK